MYVGDILWNMTNTFHIDKTEQNLLNVKNSKADKDGWVTFTFSKPLQSKDEEDWSFDCNPKLSD